MEGFGGFGTTVVGGAAVQLVGDLRKLDADLKLGVKKADDAGAQMEAQAKARAGRFAAIGGAMVATFGLLATKGVNSAVEWGGQVRLLTRELGLGAAEASRLAYVGKALGVEVDTMSKAFGVFSKHLSANDAAARKYGLTLNDASGFQKSFDRVLGETADLFRKMPDGPRKTAAALELFGRGGKELIPILNKGSAEIRQLGAEARKFGLELTGANLEAIKKFKQAQRELGASFQGLSVQLGNTLLPNLTNLVTITQTAVMWLHKIPAPVRAMVLVFMGLVGVTLLAQAAWAKLILAAGAWRGLSAWIVGANVAQATSFNQLTLAVGAHGAATAATASGGIAKLAQALGRLSIVALAGIIAYKGTGAALRSIFHADNLRTANLFGQKIGDSIYTLTAALKSFGITGAQVQNVLEEVAGKDKAKQMDALAKMMEQNGLNVLTIMKRAKAEGRDLIQVLRAMAEGEDAFSVSADTALGRLEQQFKGQAEFNRQLEELVGRGLPRQLADQLKGMGAEGLNAVYELSSGTKAELNGFVGAWRSMQQRVQTVLGMSMEQFNTWKTSTIESMDPVKRMLGDLSGQSKVSLESMIKNLRGHVKALREYRANFETVNAMHLPDALKAQLLGLTPDMLNAFVHGTKKFKDQYIRLLQASRRETGLFEAAFPKLQATIDALHGKTVTIKGKWVGFNPPGALSAALPGAATIFGQTPHEGGHVRHEGGPLGWPRFHTGGAPDDVALIAQRGEYILRRSAAQSLGRQTLDALNRHGAGALSAGVDYDALGRALARHLARVMPQGGGGRQIVMNGRVLAELVDEEHGRMANHESRF